MLWIVTQLLDPGLCCCQSRLRGGLAFAATDPIAKIAPTLGEELLKVWALIIWISPTAAGPFPAAKMQGYFGEDPLLQVDSVVAVFRRGQHQFGFTDIARVDIQRPGFVVVRQIAVRLLPLIRPNLGFGQRDRVDQCSKRQKLFFQVCAHRLCVEIGFGEVINWTS